MDSQNVIREKLATIYSQIENDKEREYFEIHKERYQLIISQIFNLHLPQNARILDIGAYPLHIYTVLNEHGYDVTGITSEHEKVKGKNLTSFNIEKTVFPFADSTFDLVLMAEVIEHLTADPNVYLKQIQRVLKSGGFLFITTPNAAHLKNRMKLLFGKNIYFPLEELYQTSFDNGSIYMRHNREFTMGELTEVLENAKFSILKKEFTSVYTPYRNRPGSILEKTVKAVGYYLTLLFPSTRDTLLLIAKK